MKKKSVWILTLIVCFMLVGCSKNNQKEYVKQFDDSQGEEYNGLRIEAKCTDLVVLDEENVKGKMKSNLNVPQLKAFAVGGKFQWDSKTMDKIKAEVYGKVVGVKIPVNLYVAHESLLFSTSGLNSLNMLGLFEGSDQPSKQLKGKYVEVKLQEDDKKMITQKEWLKNYKLSEEYWKDLEKEISAYLTTKDKKEFTKKNGCVVFTYTKKDIVEIMKRTKKVAQSKKKYAPYLDAESEKEMDNFLKGIKKMTIEHQQDTKKNKGTWLVRIEPKESADSGIKKIAFSIRVQPQKYTEKIVLPKKKDIISQEEFESYVNSQDETDNSNVNTEI